MSNFKVIHQDNNCAARCGTLTTAHGKVRTPAFMPVGTAGAVKGITDAGLSDDVPGTGRFGLYFLA